MAAVEVVVIAPEVLIVEKEALNLGVVLELFTSFLDRSEVAFVDDFVRLKVEAPVSGAGSQGDIGLPAENMAVGGVERPQSVSMILILGSPILSISSRVRSPSLPRPTATLNSLQTGRIDRIDATTG